MRDMIVIIICLAFTGLVLLRELFLKHFGQRRWKTTGQAPPVAHPPHGAFPKSEILVSKSYRSGLERTGADIRTAPAGGDAIFAPVRVAEEAMQGWSTLVVQPSIGEDGELSEPEAPDAAPSRPLLPAPSVRAELHDAEVHAMLGELDPGERIVTADASDEEQQAIANFDIRAFA